jgi:hypothetical protein
MQNAAGNLAAANGQQLNQVLGMEAEQVKGMANLSNDLALLRSTNRKAIGENQMKAGTQNLLATLGANKGQGTPAQKKKGMGIGVLKNDETAAPATTAKIPAFATPGSPLMSIMGLGQ